MVYATAVSVNRSTLYFKCAFFAQAAAKILDVDWLKFSMPQTPEESAAYDWENVDLTN